MKQKFQAKINCSAALDQCLTKITILPESIGPTEDIDEDEAEDENVSAPNISSTANESSTLFRKISTLQDLLEEAVLHPPPEGSRYEDLIEELISKYQECCCTNIELSQVFRPAMDANTVIA